MEVGKKIKRFRTAQGLSQKELAQRSGMSEPAIRNYELGNRTPSDKQLEKIAGALGVSIYAISDPNLENYYGDVYKRQLLIYKSSMWFSLFLYL